MSKLNNALPLYLKPEQGEILSSFIIRNAISHRQKPLSFTRAFFKSISIWNRDIDLNLSDVNRDKLLHSFPLNKDELNLLTLDSYKVRPGSHKTAYSPLISIAGIKHRKRFRHALSYCPWCLINHPVQYYRKTWRISILTSCISCGNQLYDSCQNCDYAITYFRNNIFSESNEYSISNCSNCDTKLYEAPIIEGTQNKLFVDDLFLPDGRIEMEFLIGCRVLLSYLLSARKVAQPIREVISEKLNYDQVPYEIRKGYYFETRRIHERRVILKYLLVLLKDVRFNQGKLLRKAKFRYSDIKMEHPYVPNWIQTIKQYA